jgi:hypothetical protein
MRNFGYPTNCFPVVIAFAKTSAVLDGYFHPGIWIKCGPNCQTVLVSCGWRQNFKLVQEF